MTPTTARIDAHTPEGERVTIHVAPQASAGNRAAVWKVWVEGGCLGNGDDFATFWSFAEAMLFASNTASAVLAGV